MPPAKPATSPFKLPTNKVTITPVGMQVTGDLSFEEWRDLATHIGQAARSISFIIGDWLVYGQGAFDPESDTPAASVPSDVYRTALTATGFDLKTLHNYAYVSRNVPHSMRSERLSWEHHRMIAKLAPADQERWIDQCHAQQDAGTRMSTRRLQKSISLGRVATLEDMEPDPADRGIENHIPFVNRLVGWWRRMRQDRFLENSTREQREALKRDLRPVIEIYRQL